MLIKSLTQPKIILSKRFPIVQATRNENPISEKYFSRRSQKNAQSPTKEIQITTKIFAEIHQEIPWLNTGSKSQSSFQIFRL